MADIKIEQINNGNGDKYFDFTLTDGDFTLDYGLNAAMAMSIFCEQRIDDETVPPIQRGGWVGNELQPIEGYEQGSLVWTKYQSNTNAEGLIEALEGYLDDGFAWMLEDGIAKDVESNVNLLANNKIAATITVTQNDNTQTATSYDLWQFTG
jgi:phage gp46-like protein